MIESALAALVAGNNRRLDRRALDTEHPNPRRSDDLPWTARLASRHREIRAEWDAFASAGGRLPHISDLIDEDQGQSGAWRAGLLASRGRPAGIAGRFPEASAALAEVPGLWSALWSLMEPGTVLPQHTGPNAGVLRAHLGVVCEGDTALEVAGHRRSYREGEVIVFDDTAPHQAWNRSDSVRVTLFLEVLRPAPAPVDIANRAVQRLLAIDARYRLAPDRAREWDHALNG